MWNFKRTYKRYTIKLLGSIQHKREEKYHFYKRFINKPENFARMFGLRYTQVVRWDHAQNLILLAIELYNLSKTDNVNDTKMNYQTKRKYISPNHLGPPPMQCRVRHVQGDWLS